MELGGGNQSFLRGEAPRGLILGTRKLLFPRPKGWIEILFGFFLTLWPVSLLSGCLVAEFCCPAPESVVSGGAVPVRRSAPGLVLLLQTS